MRPLHVAASHAQGVLIIDWGDGARSAYPLRGLRAACPCAECRGGHEAMADPGSPDLLLQPQPEGRSAELQSLEGVGNYAAQPIRTDGRSFGVCSREYLRQLSPDSLADGRVA
jgi:DUF971 family protein